jgi:hypothetical protein
MRIRNIVNAMASGLLFLSLTGCASIVDGGRKTVSIKSEPSDAKVTVFDKKGSEVVVGQTPALFPLKRSGGFFTPTQYRVVIEKQGYTTAEFQIKSTINGWYFGNVLFGGLIGLVIVDPATGAMWTLSPREINTVLESRAASVLREEGGLIVMLREDVPQTLAGSLQPLVASCAVAKP